MPRLRRAKQKAHLRQGFGGRSRRPAYAKASAGEAESLIAATPNLELQTLNSEPGTLNPEL
jgi:hypothetical protein